ncbi:RecQ Superfamily II DNA helicase [Pyrenophora tritici-repentis]|nr:RecQ Superfamily II DNA helicase [Pyrenophora tritici-repentis]
MSPRNAINGTTTTVVPPCSAHAGNMNNKLLPAPVGITATTGLSPAVMALIAASCTPELGLLAHHALQLRSRPSSSAAATDPPCLVCLALKRRSLPLAASSLVVQACLEAQKSMPIRARCPELLPPIRHGP